MEETVNSSQGSVINENDPSMRPLSWLTRIGYGLGDTAYNVAAGALNLLAFFYTDYVGIPAATVGLVMLISRCFDGFSDIIMGFIVERTKSKWGMARPWIMWMSLPFCISVILLYTVPMGDATMQFIYILVTYNLCSTVCSTAMNLPYGSVATLMTRIPRERDMLSIVRMTLSPLGKILAISATLPLIEAWGNDQMAWIKVMSMWAALCLVLFLVCFSQCTETVVYEAREQTKSQFSIGRQLMCLLTNQYFWFALIVWTMQCVIQSSTTTILPYYCQYIFDSSSWYSILYMMEILIMVVLSITVSPILLKKFGKRNMSMIGLVIALAGHLFYMTNPYSFNMLVMSCVLRGIGFAPLNSVVFGFIGDVVDFGQYKYHIRQEGLVFSGSSVGTKLGQGLASAVIASLMSTSGYISSAAEGTVQPESALNMIVNLYRIVPAAIFVVLIIMLLFYKLDKKHDIIMKELADREARGEM